MNYLFGRPLIEDSTLRSPDIKFGPPLIGTQSEIQLIEALAWLDTSKQFEFNFVQKFFNHEYTGVIEQSESL